MITFSRILLLLCIALTPVSHADSPSGTVLAKVGDETVTLADLREYARLNPYFFAHMQIPGGPSKVLNNLITERLLAKEGERRGIPRTEATKLEARYAYSVRETLLKPCPAPSEQEAKGFYDQNIDIFSTPLYMRLSRITLSAGSNPEAVMARLSDIRSRIERGESDIATLADELSEDPVGKGNGGDLGYLPIKLSEPGDMADLVDLQIGAMHGPIVQGSFVSLYRVTGRHEPIPEPFEDVQEKVIKAQMAHCHNKQLEPLLAELKSRWPVEIHAQELSTRPAAPANP